MTQHDSSLKGKVLLVSSLGVAKDNTYQNLVGKLNGGANLERQLIDRISEGAITLSESSYSSIYLALTPEDPRSFDLFKTLVQSLMDDGLFQFQIVGSPSSNITNEIQGLLKLSGLIDVVVNDSNIISGKKPSSASLRTYALKNTHDSTTTNNESKLALWMTEADDEEIEDDNTLLNETDRVNPTIIKRPDDCEIGTSGKRKACKNCTCGRAELEKEEIKLNIADDLPSTGNTFTSSCGNCYLGDAFRCSGCPYLGMPAFKPGEAIALSGTFGSDDI